jgi:hypothetical protein
VNGFGAIDIDRNPSSPFFGNLYVSFPDFPTGTTTGADLNTYVIRSTNGGSAWSSRVKVNDDNFGATQFFPWLAVDQSDGTVNVSWYDTRLDPINRKTQMVYARSSNGGVSFEPNVLVSDNGANWRNAANFSDENSVDNTSFNGNQYGDYAGIAAANRQVHPLWMDSRMFFPLADTQAPTRREDNATSAVVNCTVPSAIGAPGVNSTTAPSVVVSWSAPASWGTNATTGTYSVYRNTSAVFPGGSPLVSGLTATSYNDNTGVNGTTYFYFVRATNNCPGTILTPMSTDSGASPSVIFGTAGTAVGTLQGTVTAAGNGVSNATVTAGALSATTNASGFYQFAAIDAGTYTVTASATGYSPASANGVVVVADATTVQNLSLTPTTANACFTDTTYADFSTATGTNVSITSSPGDVKLASTGAEGPDQVSSPAALSTTNNLSATTWTGQTFRAGITGNLTKITIGLGLASGTSGTCTVEIRNLNGINPGTTVLATSTLGPVTNVGSAALYTTTFTTPAAVVSGTSYSIVLRTSVGSTVFGVRGSTAGGSSLANGQVFTTTNSGTLWTAVAADLWFTSFVTPPTTFQLSGSIAAIKDSGAVTGTSANWSTLSWTATTPANTAIQFQAAGSNNAAGPFTFVGPDGTAGTFFTTTGASLAQFNGKRYLQYKAFLSTTVNTVSPTLSDVTICEQVIDCTPSVPAITPSPAQVCGSSLGNTASGPAGATTYAWSITNGSITSATNGQNVTYTAGASGNVTLMLTVTTASGCTASNSVAVPINAIPATPTITPGGPTTFCAGDSVTLTSSSASGNQWYLGGNPIGGATNQQYVAVAAGSYTVVVTESACASAPSSATVVTVNPIPATPTITPGGPTTFCAGGSVTLTSSSASGNQWFLDGNVLAGESGQQYVATASGDYTVTVTAGGCPSLPSSATTVTVNPIPSTPTITPGGPTTFCAGGSVTLTSSSSSGNQWYLDGNSIGGATAQQYVASAAGDYTVVVTSSGCSSAPSAATTVTVNQAPATPTITPGGPTTFCAGGSVTLTSSSATGNQWYLDGNAIGGETNQQYVATASGSYTVTVTAGGCASAPSSATAVTVNPIPATPTITPGGPTTFCMGGSVTLTSSSASGNQWYLDGNPIGGATAQQYVASAAGGYTVVVTASGCPSLPSAATTVTVNPVPATPTITPGGPTTFCAGGSVTLTSSSASGNEWYLDGNPIGGATNQQYVATASGSYTVTVTASGCASAPSSATAVTVNPAPATPTITPGGPTTFCTGGSVTLTSSSASGNQWYLNGNPIGGETNQQYVATASGNYTVVVTASGCPSAPSAATTVTVNPVPATPVIGTGGPTTFCAGGSVTLTSSSASGNQWYLDGNPIGGATGQQYVASAGGSFTVIVTTSGCSSAASAATVVTVNPAPATPTITPGGPTTFCTGGNVTLTSSSATGNQWYLNGNPIGGETNQQYVATASGNYTVVVTASGCPSAPSAATTVTVNPVPATPVITPGGPTTFCAGGSVTLTSSSASGNQWSLDGNPIGGATGQQYVATASGNYTVVVTTTGCSSAASAATAVTVNPAPATPTITPGGPTTFCAGGNVTLTSSSASGNQWSLNGSPIGGATAQQYVATASGSYTVVVTASGCSSTASAATVVTVNPIPATPIIGTSGPTTFCAGGSVTLTSSTASGNQWYLNGNPIGGATAQQYVATASGNYTVAVTTSGCSGAQSAATAVTVNPIPATPTITPGGPTTFCAGGSVTLTSSSASGNQWSLNGNPIGGATAQQYVATGAGDYTVTVTTTGCSSAASAATTVTVNPNPVATITAPGSVAASSTGNVASVANAGAGATYAWTIGNGTITGGIGTNSITFTAGSAGLLTLNVTVTTGAGCSASSGTTNVTVTAVLPAVTVTSITPSNGPVFGNTPITVNGTGFLAGATVTLGGTAATNVVVVNSTKITAKTAAHAGGAVNVVVTNTNTSSGTLVNGFTYRPQQFDPNNDNMTDPADIFYLVAYLFTGGPAPAGPAGMLSGDANGDGVVDPSDIFYIVHFLFTGGPVPNSVPAHTASSSVSSLRGAVSLGQAQRRDGRWIVPVVVTMAPGSAMPDSLSLRVRFSGQAADATVRRVVPEQPVFEISRLSADALSYLVSFDERTPLMRADGRSVVVAELSFSSGAGRLEIDPLLTMLTTGGTQKATVAGGTLRVTGTTIIQGDDAPRPRVPNTNAN